MIRGISAFFAFWFDFVVGDDWRVALGVVAGLGLTYAVSTTSVPAWWILPIAVVTLLPYSVWRAGRRR